MTDDSLRGDVLKRKVMSKGGTEHRDRRWVFTVPLSFRDTKGKMRKDVSVEASIKYKYDSKTKGMVIEFFTVHLEFADAAKRAFKRYIESECERLKLPKPFPNKLDVTPKKMKPFQLRPMSKVVRRMESGDTEDDGVAAAAAASEDDEEGGGGGGGEDDEEGGTEDDEEGGTEDDEEDGSDEDGDDQEAEGEGTEPTQEQRVESLHGGVPGPVRSESGDVEVIKSQPPTPKNTPGTNKRRKVAGKVKVPPIKAK